MAAVPVDPGSNAQAPYPPPQPAYAASDMQYPSVNVAPAPSAIPMSYPANPQYQAPYQPLPNPGPTYAAQPNYVVMPDTVFGFNPQNAPCPTCRGIVQTRTQRIPSATLWISFVLLLILFICIWLLPLCCIPFCVPACYNVKHYCTRCGQLLGERRA